MAIPTVEKKMLFCPKCQHKYEETGQRFCINDGVRLLPAQKVNAASEGVFTSILRKMNAQNQSREAIDSPRFVDAETKGKMFSQPFETDLLQKEKIAKSGSEAEKARLASRIIKPEEIPSGQAALGNRETHPTGRLALSWENPHILLGQTVKGRYYVIDKFSQNESSITYLAEDRLVPGKKAFVCVLMEEEGDSETDKIFAEERVSLSHINHPNVNRVIDSGTLLEGKIFIVSEFVEGRSLKELLNRKESFNIQRTARIIRQAARALSDVHQNGVLHRNLSPSDIILSVSETGVEQVKLTNFALFSGRANGANSAYKSPEQLEGKSVNYAGDIYSLAVIAYQMLTGRLPFNASTVSEHLRLRREGKMLGPSSLRSDIPSLADDILKKALSFRPSDRYPKARDFGDAFFNALTAVAPWKEEIEEGAETKIFENELIFDEKDDLLSVLSDEQTEAEALPSGQSIRKPSTPLPEAVTASEDETVKEIKAAKQPEKLAWERRSIEAPKPVGRNWTMFSVLGVFLLFVVTSGIVYYFLSGPNEPKVVVPEITQTETPVTTETVSPIAANMETPPMPRQIEAPPNSVYFENSKENLSKDLLKHYRGFSLYYPNNWKRNRPGNKFIDISIDAPNGAPIEQLMISSYESKGTFSLDKEEFPKLVEKSNKDLSDSLDGNYEVISEGETTIQNGRWKVYEVKFRGKGNIGGVPTTLWGRRLWVPVQRPGARSGFIITMLATSFSNDVKSVEDVGVKGKLAEILETFEPMDF